MNVVNVTVTEPTNGIHFYGGHPTSAGREVALDTDAGTEHEALKISSRDASKLAPDGKAEAGLLWDGEVKGVDAGDDAVDETRIRIDFQLDVSVMSMDARHRGRYLDKATRRATVNWYSDLSGTVENVAGDYVWKPGATAENKALSSWNNVTDGSRPVDTVKLARQLFNAKPKDFKDK